MPRSKDKFFTLDQIATLIGVKSPSEAFEDADYSEAYHYSYQYALSQGKTEEEAEEAGMKAEGEEQERDWNRYADAVLQGARDLFGAHNLKLVEVTSKKHGTLYRLVPVKSWHHTLQEIIRTINGVGYFHFNSVGELLRSGPYSPKQAGMSHLGWISDYPSVYGDLNPQRHINRLFQ